MAMHRTSDPLVEQDYLHHVNDYRAFLRGVRRSVVAAALVLALMAYFLT